MSDKEIMREIHPFRFISAFLLSALFSFEGRAGAPLVYNASTSAYQICKSQSDSGGLMTTQTQRDAAFTACMASYTSAAEEANRAAAAAAAAQSAGQDVPQDPQQDPPAAANRGSSTANRSRPAPQAPKQVQQTQDSSSGGIENFCGPNNSCPSGQECALLGKQSKSYQCAPVKAAGNAQAATNNGNDTTGSSSSDISDCQAEYQKLYDACKADTDSAVSACDERNNGSMSQVTKVAKQASLMLGQQTAGSAQAACSKAGDLSVMANAAVAAYASYCGNGRDSCLNSCQQARTLLKQKGERCFSMNMTEGGQILDRETDNVSVQLKSCSSLSSKVTDAQQATANYGQTLMQASQCASLTSASNNLDLCKSNPNLPGCVAVSTECTSQACICAKNPIDPSCTGVNKGGGSTIAGGADPSLRLTGANAADTSINGDLNGTGIEQGELKKTGPGAAIDGKQGGGSGIGGGGGGGTGVASGRGGGAAEKDPTSVNSGFYGGSGGGGGFGGGSTANGGRGYAGNGAAANGKLAADPNLRAFLPGGKFDPHALRGLAGAAGPDGITGPNTDIWQKVQNRYQSVSPTLLP